MVGVFRQSGGVTWESSQIAGSVLQTELAVIEAELKRWNLTLPGSLIERKSLGCAFHLRGVEQSLVESHLPKIKSTLATLCAQLNLSLLLGKSVVEVRNNAINKGSFIDWYVSTRFDETNEKPALFAIGDDVTDEDMFEVVNKRGGVSVTVGEEASRASIKFSSRATFIARFTKILASEIAHER